MAKNRNNFFNKISLLVLLFSLMVFSVNALTVTIPNNGANVGNNGGTIRSSIRFEATYSAADRLQFFNATNFSLYRATAGSNNTNITNAQVVTNVLSIVNNTVNIPDLVGYDFNITALNSSGQFISGLVTSIGVDNTNPLAKLMLDVSQIKLYKGLQADCGGSTDNLGSLDFNLTLTNPNGVVVRVVQKIGSNGLVDFNQPNDFDITGDYTIGCEAVDKASNYANVTTTATVRSNHGGSIDLSVPSGVAVSTSQSRSGQGGNYLLYFGGLVVVLGGLVVILSKGGSKKRR